MPCAPPPTSCLVDVPVADKMKAFEDDLHDLFMETEHPEIVPEIIDTDTNADRRAAQEQY